jgi:phosphorylcholine metabolism protein LicD
MKNKKKLPMNILVLLIYVAIIFILIAGLSYWLFIKISSYKNRKINSNDRINSLTGLYHVVSDIAEQNNIKLFLLFGTLLGQQRNSKLICYDYDVDVGIMSEDFDILKTALKKNIDPSKYTLIILNNHFTGKHIHVKDNKTSLMIDVEIYKKEKNGSFKREISYYMYLLNTYILQQCNKWYIPQDWLVPLKPVTFLGKNVYIPNNPTDWMTCEYGSNYLTPDHNCNQDCSKCIKV